MISIVMPIHKAVLDSKFDVCRIETAHRLWPHYNITTTGLIVSKEQYERQHRKLNVVDMPYEDVHVLEYESLSVRDSDWNSALSSLLRLMSLSLKDGRYLQIDDDEFLVVEDTIQFDHALEDQECRIGIIRRFMAEEGYSFKDGIRLITRDIQDCHREYATKYPERLRLLDVKIAYVAHICTLREASFKLRGGATCRHKRRAIIPNNDLEHK